MIEFLPYFAGLITLIAGFAFAYAISRPYTKSVRTDVSTNEPVVPAVKSSFPF
jgi:hypothetical protein